jgi:cytochrome oxidase Cu insertion factor (SCO1/SenC/PrrC family)
MLLYSKFQKRPTLISLIAVVVIALIGAPSFSNATGVVGQMAPDFTLKDTSDKAVKLADFKGKQVVLEWVNPNCPFVKKHYQASQNMQDTQRDALARKDTVWLAVNSTNPTHSDYMTPAALSGWLKDKGAQMTAVLMDESGDVGKAYGAKTTPHMYIINPAGVLVYAGGIDSIRSATVSDIAKATNYVKVALGETAKGKAVTTATSVPYGCSVKYKD